MKKFLVLISLVLISGFYFITLTSKAAAASTADQYCSNSNLQSYESIRRNGTDYRQAFVPTQNRVNNIAVKVGGNNISGQATLRVYSSPSGTDNQLLRSDRTFSNLNSTVVWYFNDFGDVTLTPGTTYYISLASSVDFLYWYSVDSAGCTAPGMAYLNGAQQLYKLDFTTFGFTYTPPQSDDTTSGNSTTTADTSSAVSPTGQSTGSNNAPTTTTSAAIKAAEGLKAEYANSAVKLTWTKSATTDIDGYKIFRSEEKTSNFKEIGKTVKATVEYTDNKDLVANKTYYYFVRAYKATVESASTSTIEIKIPEATAATTTAATIKKGAIPFFTSNTDATTDYSEIELYWILGGVIGTLLILLIAYERERARTIGLLSGKHFRLSK